MKCQRNDPFSYNYTAMSLFWSLLLLQLHSMLWLQVSSSSSSLSKQPQTAIAMPHCNDSCGEVSIPFPFGIGARSCYHNSWYKIVCNYSFDPPKAFLQRYNLEVTNITWPALQVRLIDAKEKLYSIVGEQALTVRLPTGNICATAGGVLKTIDFGLEGSPYSYSRDSNIFMVEGCSGAVLLKNRTGQIVAGCATVCTNSQDAITKATGCNGARCCQSIISDDGNNDYYEIVADHTTITGSNACNLTAALIDAESAYKMAGRWSHLSTVPVSLSWKATYLTYDNTRNSPSVDCDANLPQTCLCKFFYKGSPYLPNGCQIVQECKRCRHNCAFNETTSQFYCRKNTLASIVGFSTGAGSVLLALASYCIYRMIKLRRELKRRATYFKRNGGLLLKQQMSSSDGFVQKMTIFTIGDLEKATDNFHQNRILGQGGQGTVYKGMLMDGNIVAIKKSKKVDMDQLDQFINEVVVLSQINHRNVVKLIGCCLETEVPLLVYEFISNGTLHEHIHDPAEEFHVSWKMRLQIAAESAGALAYLHSSSSAPIYHRDIKSSNILLDEKYRAKVSDFGTSRTINIEQTHVTTRVQGTYGYLDPEYFRSNQFTEKSDVYSFGVVLVELITGMKPVFPTESGVWKSLAVEFLSQIENSHLFDIVDTRIIEEGKEEEFIAVADIARQCLNMNGKQRPTMKEVAMVLGRIRFPNSNKQPSDTGKCVVSEIDDAGPSGKYMFSDEGSFSSFSIEAQALGQHPMTPVLPEGRMLQGR